MSTETIQPIDTFIGTVLHGDKRGRTIGYPTVNLELDHDTRDGVYVSRVKVEGEWMPSMTSVGQAKTFNRKERLVETNIFDYSGDLYGKEIEVQLLHYLREMEKFPSVDALIEALKQDEYNARKYFKQTAQ